MQWVLTDFEPSVRAAEVYGTGDMACVLYTLDELNVPDAERDGWAGILRSFQDPESGYLIAKTAFLSKVHNPRSPWRR